MLLLENSPRLIHSSPFLEPHRSWILGAGPVKNKKQSGSTSTRILLTRHCKLSKLPWKLLQTSRLSHNHFPSRFFFTCLAFFIFLCIRFQIDGNPFSDQAKARRPRQERSFPSSSCSLLFALARCENAALRKDLEHWTGSPDSSRRQQNCQHLPRVEAACFRTCCFCIVSELKHCP